jgi:type IV pilus assembly protein PilE
MEAILSVLLRHRPARASARGVTLIELMVVIVVLAVLATIAVPSYRRYLLRSQRSEAKIALLQLQTAQEKHYLQNNVYTSNLTAASPAGLGLPAISETGKYNISVAGLGAGAQTYTATAAPRAGGGQTDDTKCASFTITDRGVRGVSGTGTVQECWK